MRHNRGRLHHELLGKDEQLLTDRAVMRIVHLLVVVIPKVEHEKQAGRHRHEGDARNYDRRRANHCTRLSAIDSHPHSHQVVHAQAGQRPSRRTCWRLITNPLCGILAIGTAMSVMQRV